MVIAPIAGLDLDRDEISMNRHPALVLCLSMIFSENRYTLFRIMRQVTVRPAKTFPRMP
jgi:hypothetical protein